VRIRDPEVFSQIRELSPDLILVVAYGQILPREILDLPACQSVNLHFSLLPKYRGAAPVQWALIKGEATTGVTTLFMSEKLDAGPILIQRESPIRPDDNAGTLAMRLAGLGAGILIETIELLRVGKGKPVVQDESKATLAPSLKKEDGRLDFSKNAKTVLNQIRGVTPWPGATTLLNGRLLKIHSAEVLPSKGHGSRGMIVEVGPGGIDIACGKDLLRIKELQLEGKRRLPCPEFLKGHRLEPGMRLG
jgi:methionyl-tRNA formyltransferase